ncbi:LCCL domain-containing protein [Nostoc sp. UHCC 0302]|uniref:LCCL domain-containing protein n=1 Tax=Nostoc sp. UHCC 0302 TaxID=3134896 RepID=UPI00311CA06B
MWQVFRSSLVMLNTLLIVMLPTVSHSQSKPTAKQINWNTSASSLKLSGQIDRAFKFVCPSSGRISSVYGTDTYYIGSSICSAAVHAGLITAKNGGQVTIKIISNPEGNYVATNRHGVRSNGLNSGSEGFIFLNTNGSPVANLDSREINWNTSASSLDLSGRLDQDFKFVCQPNGRIGSVYGTGTYYIGSSICSAAVHAGLITAKNGGQVTIKIIASPEGNYVATNRHGVRSNGLNSGSDSFIFLNPDGSPVAIEPTSSNVPAVNRVINKVKPKVCLPVVGCL